MTSDLSPRDQALLQTPDPRKLSSGQWKRYAQLVDGWLIDQGMSEGCTCAGSSGDWETFGTHWTKGDHQFMANFITMPMVAACIQHGKGLDTLMEFIKGMRR